MVGAFPALPAPPLGPWVNDERASNMPCSSGESLGQWWESISSKPFFSIGSLDQCERASNVPYSSIGSLGQWWEHFQHSLLLCWVLGSMVGAFPALPAPPLGPWVNGERVSNMPCSSVGSLGQWWESLPLCPSPEWDS